ncbi:MAG: DUF2550 domain-containing protein [Actinomycetota bacterium]|nr:DUF2550 domain-containing protein [Actinomycetota bacterium]
MPVWLWFVDSLAFIVGSLVIVVLVLTLRRRAIARSSGSFDLSINKHSEASASGWTLGMARYSENHLEWFRTFSFSWRPRYRFERGHIHIHDRREPEGREAFAVHAGHVIVECHTEVGVRQMAIGPSALTGLLAWLEASPPGHSVNNVV